jgi:hypothetical protein
MRLGYDRCNAEALLKLNERAALMAARKINSATAYPLAAF